MDEFASRQTRTGLLAGRSPLLRLQSDERLIALIRSGNDGAFELLIDRYRSRLLGFCRHMLGSQEDAEDVLQEVFAASHKAIRADEREINVRPWLYRIARNRCLNHLRRPTQDGRDTMDDQIGDHGTTTADVVHRRADFRHLLDDIQKLPETQRSALLLREIDALSYDQIANAMETTVPSVKSLLVRARMSLAEAAESRKLSCGDVRLELAEVAEGLKKVTPPIRRHMRECEQCRAYRTQLKRTSTAMAIALPLGPLMIFKKLVLAKLGIAAGSGAAAGGGIGGTAAGTSAAGTAAAAGGAAAGGAAASGAIAGGAAAGGLAAAGTTAAGGGAIAGIGAVATKAITVTAATALLAGGAVEVQRIATPPPVKTQAAAVVQPKQPVFDSGGQAAATLPPVPAVKDELQAAADSKPADQDADASAAPADATETTPVDGTQDPATGVTGATGAEGPVATDPAQPVDAQGTPPADDASTGGAALPPPSHSPPAADGSTSPPPAATPAPAPAR